MGAKRRISRILTTIVLLAMAGCNGQTATAIPEISTATLPATAMSATSTAPPAASSTATPMPAATVTDTPMPSATSAPTLFPISKLSIEPGEFYFNMDGQPTFLLTRNPTGKTAADFDAVLKMAAAAGTHLIRVHLTHGWWGDMWMQKDFAVINKDWSVNETWARDWERFFDQAEQDGILVLPVFGVWADWNRGKPDLGNAGWQYNPLNVKNGGPLDAPGSLFTPDSETQKHWMAWMGSLVRRWQGRRNIAGWEIFSEINIAEGPEGYRDTAGGVSEAAGVEFTRRALDVIRAADEQRRPVTLSLAEVYSAREAWAEYYRLEELDFVEIHMYHDQLDRTLVSDVKKHLEKYHKPVMIGESGLWSLNLKADAPGPQIAIRHALWAGLVSGAMNGRGLWYNDGYLIYDPIPQDQAMRILRLYADLETPVVNFTAGVDFSGFHPLTATSTGGVWGAAVGNEKMILGWFRDAGCEPPGWPLKDKISGQTVTVLLPENAAANWKVDFYDTKTGKDLLGTTTAIPTGGVIRVPLPNFRDDIALKAYSEE